MRSRHERKKQISQHCSSQDRGPHLNNGQMRRTGEGGVEHETGKQHFDFGEIQVFDVIIASRKQRVSSHGPCITRLQL